MRDCGIFGSGLKFCQFTTAYQSGAFVKSQSQRWLPCNSNFHYSDVIMGAMASQITSVTIFYSSFYSGADQRKQSSVSLAFVRGIHRWPVNSPHKGPVTRKMFHGDVNFSVCTLAGPLRYMCLPIWGFLIGSLGPNNAANNTPFCGVGAECQSCKWLTHWEETAITTTVTLPVVCFEGWLGSRLRFWCVY